jgi:hypothetical protein
MNFVTIASWAVLALAVAAGIIVFIRAKKQGADTMPAILGAYNLLSNFLLLASSLLHLGAVIGEAITGKVSGGAAFSYNFRFYSLLLISFVMGVPALICLKATKGLIWKDRAAWKKVSGWSLVLLAVIVPMAPIQGFAAAFAVFVAVNLVLLRMGMKYYTASESAGEG